MQVKAGQHLLYVQKPGSIIHVMLILFTYQRYQMHLLNHKPRPTNTKVYRLPLLHAKRGVCFAGLADTTIGVSRNFKTTSINKTNK